MESKTFPASNPERRRAPGDLCDFVRKLGCKVSWVEGEQAAKLYGWEHPEYRNEDLWEDAEDCAEAFMKHLMSKLAYELDHVPITRDEMFEIKFVLGRAVECPAYINKEQAQKALACAERALSC